MMTVLLSGLVMILLVVPGAVHAQGCPPNSSPHREVQSGGKVTVFCRCNPGFAKVGGACEPAQKKDEEAAAAAAASFVSRSAAAAVAAKEIITAPLTPGSATPGLLSGADYEKKVAEHEARKADVFRRMIEQSKLRDECRKRLPACSIDGKAFDQREADRRRDRQYFLWGEASYYIPWKDLLEDAPAEMTHEIGTWGGIKTIPIWEPFYIWLKRDIGVTGSTPPGGDGNAQRGLQKAIKDNQ